jgi:phosphoribosylaminoimidazolecarboxamide formyltransferase/IMP cyclohydrolase
MKLALLSVYDQDKPGLEKFAQELNNLNYHIISSGGTAKYLQEHGIAVTDVEKITKQKPVLKHRVVTLTPQIHGGLLATADMQDELNMLGWPKIDLLYVTFYPLEAELYKPAGEANFDSCIEKTDIGGPTMVRSACKGGEVIVLTSKSQEQQVLGWMKNGEPNRNAVLYALRGRAERAVADYIQLSARVYTEFGNLTVPELHL